MTITKSKQINHSQYRSKTRAMTIKELSYTIRDCKETLEAMPDGENAGYYADEINYCSMELSRRMTLAEQDAKNSQ